MPFSPKNRQGTISGIIFVATVASGATYISQLSFVSALGLSPLVIGIVIGIFYANTLHNHFPPSWESGIVFSAKKILRFAIVVYGFRITFQQIAEVGLHGFLVSLIMLGSTMLIGIWLGTKIFKMDRDTSILTASGASVCGAAAVLATEPVLKADEYKTAVAVSMVVLFGTISMFLYPVLYTTIIEPDSGFLHMDPQTFGIYVGGTIHEVAQVVAVPASIPNTPPEMANSAVIVKMTRVLLIAPMLIVLGVVLSLSQNNHSKNGKKIHIVIPWFAVYFVIVAGINSLILYYLNTSLQPYASSIKSTIDNINTIDTFLLTMAMTALGMGTQFSKFKNVGMAPLYTAIGMFVWLVAGGFVITKAIGALVA